MAMFQYQSADGLPSESQPLDEGYYPAKILAAVDEQSEKGASCKLTLLVTTPDNRQVQRTFWLPYPTADMKAYPKQKINSFIVNVGGFTPQQVATGVQYDPCTWVGRNFFVYYRPGEDIKDAITGTTKKGSPTYHAKSAAEYQQHASAAAAGAAPTAAAQPGFASAPAAQSGFAAQPGFASAPTNGAGAPMQQAAPAAPGFAMPPGFTPR